MDMTKKKEMKEKARKENTIEEISEIREIKEIKEPINKNINKSTTNNINQMNNNNNKPNTPNNNGTNQNQKQNNNNNEEIILDDNSSIAEEDYLINIVDDEVKKEEICMFCNRVGKLIKCQSCSNYTHLLCSKLKKRESIWTCPNCTNKFADRRVTRNFYNKEYELEINGFFLEGNETNNYEQYLLYELRDIQTKLYNNKTNNQIYEIFNENIFIFDKLNILKIITNNNPLIYKGYENCLISDPDNQQCIYHLIKSKKVVGKKRILLGEKGDGSYVILDDFENIKIAYSFGISNMIQFDNELAKRGIDVYMFDHTINSLPFNHSKFHWNKIGLAGLNESSNQLKTLEQLIINNGHINEFNMILKIDIEHCEWNSLKDLPDHILKQFKYIIIEFHFINPDNEGKLYYDVIKKLSKYHQVFPFSSCRKTENPLNQYHRYLKAETHG